MKLINISLLSILVSTGAFAQQTLSAWSDKLSPEQKKAFYQSLEDSGEFNPEQLKNAQDSIQVQINKETGKALVTGDENKHTIEQLAIVGFQLGLNSLYTLEFLDQIRRDGHAWIDGSLKLQPSAQQQHLVLAGDYHPFKKKFNSVYIGLHGTRTYLNPPWCPSYDKNFDRAWAYGVQAGARGPVILKNNRLIGSVEISYEKQYSPLLLNLPDQLNLRIGIGYRIFKR